MSTALSNRSGRRLLAALTCCSAVLCGAAAAGAPAGGGAAGEAAMRRLTEQQYRNTIADIFGADIRVAGRFEPDMRSGGLLAAGASRVAVTPAGYQQYEQIALGIAGQVAGEAQRERLIGCAPGRGDPAGRDCMRRVFSRYGLQLYRRPLSESELRGVVATAQRAMSTVGDFHAGVAAGITRLLTSPNFLFRFDTRGENGELDGWSRAARLSYFLWNTTPDQALLAAAGRGELDTPAGYREQLRRLLRSPRFEVGVRAFFSDYLRLDELDTVAKDTAIYPRFVSSAIDAAREQTLRTVTDTLLDRRLPYSALFTTRRMAMHRALGPIYDIPVASKAWSFHQFAADDPRAGLLTQVSFLAAHSHPGRTSPTLRGIAIREIFLCETVPAAPANVSFTVVQDTRNPVHRTTRERLQAHVDDAECAGCHRVMDPPGLALEHFDGIGQFRRLENGVEIDTSGDIEGMAFADAAELGEVLSGSAKVQRCLVSNVYRYALGRDLRSGEEAILDALLRQFRRDGERLPELMQAVAASPVFRGDAANPAGQLAAFAPSPLNKEIDR